MSRSGYNDDGDDQWSMIRWRGAVASAIGGKRGQALLREMRDAMDAMPEKRLVSGSLVEQDGDRCALGCVAVARGIDVSKIDPEDYDQVAKEFGVSAALVREVAYENDDFNCDRSDPDADAKRWSYMRKWVDRHIK